MVSRTWLLALAVTLLVSLPQDLAGQDPIAECDFARCALYVSEWEFGWSLLRLESREPVAYPGFWVADLTPVFDGNPEAQALAAGFRRTQNTGSAAVLAGVLTVVVPAALSEGRLQSPWTIVGVSLLGLGVFQSVRADAYLEQAVAVYNAGLAGRPR